MGPVQEDAREESVILISDDESESPTGNSVVLVELLEKSIAEENKTEEVVDEESQLVVTFCKQGKVMPHARYDCMIHPFERAECETCSPLENNASICDQCYCYICDKLASECRDWTAPSHSHCNAHNKSKFWKDQRDVALAGILVMFNFELTDIDADLRHGGSLLVKFVHELAVEYNKYLVGERVPPNSHECFCVPKRRPGQCNICRQRHMEVMYRYSDIFELVTAFLNQAEKENPKAAAIMLLGAAKEIALHKDPAQNLQNLGRTASLRMAVPCLMERIITQLQRMLVLCDFPKVLYEKFISFFQSISLPCHCYTFSNSLNVMPWDHGLLTTVLKGQNITGQRTQKGKKIFLWEVLPVIQARVEKMEDQRHYKEIVRYLKAVKCNDIQGLKKLRDKIPFYLCKTGDFVSAVHSLLLPFNNLACCTACRITPVQFEIYLKMFRTGSVPSGNNFQDSGEWTSAGNLSSDLEEMIEWTVETLKPVSPKAFAKVERETLGQWSPLKNCILIKHALKLLYINLSLYRNPKCWSSLIMILGSSPILEKHGHLNALSLKEPPPDFQEMVVSLSCILLNELKTKANVSLPSHVFSPPLQLEACLILTVQAVRQMLLHDLSYLSSFLEITLAFGSNFWALRLLLNGLSFEEHVLHGTINLLLRDLNFQKAAMLNLWKHLGAQYVGELLCLYLTCRNRKMQSIGISIIHIISENLNVCPWAKHLRNFLNTGLRMLPLGTTVDDEVARFITVLEKI